MMVDAGAMQPREQGRLFSAVRGRQSCVASVEGPSSSCRLEISFVIVHQTFASHTLWLAYLSYGDGARPQGI